MRVVLTSLTSLYVDLKALIIKRNKKTLRFFSAENANVVVVAHKLSVRPSVIRPTVTMTYGAVAIGKVTSESFYSL